MELKKDKKSKETNRIEWKPTLYNPLNNPWPTFEPELQLNVFTQFLEYVVNSPKLMKYYTNQLSRILKSNLDNVPKESVRTKIFEWLIVGNNSVTQLLQNSLKNESNILSFINLILVCKEDLNCDIVVDHLPKLIQQYEEPIPLCTLPKNSQNQICALLGIRSCSVIAIKAQSQIFQPLLKSRVTLPKVSPLNYLKISNTPQFQDSVPPKLMELRVKMIKIAHKKKNSKKLLRLERKRLKKQSQTDQTDKALKNKVK